MKQYNSFMAHTLPRFIVAIAVTLAFLFFSVTRPGAAAHKVPSFADSPYALIEAVNAVRTSYGLAPYAISSILMVTAQNQADYMAATGVVSHTGAGGTSVTDRLLAAGYPLAGDLSLGGFRSENITAGSEGMSAQSAVNQWTGDSLHLTTMISPNLSEIGAGIAVNDGRAYFVIDAAQPTLAGEAPTLGTAAAAESIAPNPGGIIIPVVVSTPNANGDLLHEVKAGQTLWQIASAYNTKIEEIKRLNHLPDNNIYPGTKLLIKKNVVATPPMPTHSETLDTPSTPIDAPAYATAVPVLTASGTPVGRPALTNNVMTVALGIVLVAILGGGILAWLGRARK